MASATDPLSRSAPAGRTSVYVEGFSHKNPIPAACRIGPWLESGSIQGNDPATGRPAATLEAQCALMLATVVRIVEAGGGRATDIAKITVWMSDPAKRAALNVEWLKCFPDPRSRPARHTMQGVFDDPARLIECSFTAYLA